MRVYNELIDVHLHGDATVKQYSGVGPLMVALPDGRGEVKAASGDYVLYLGGVASGVVLQSLFDPLREETEPLDPAEEVSTAATIEETVLDNAGAPLSGTTVFLGQNDVPIAEGRTNAEGVVTFSVLPGTYQLRPKDKTKGPVVTVEAVIETVPPPPPEGGVLSVKKPGLGGKLEPPKPDVKPPLGSLGAPRPDAGLPGQVGPKA
jgi:hypothetical protein